MAVKYTKAPRGLPSDGGRKNTYLGLHRSGRSYVNSPFRVLLMIFPLLLIVFLLFPMRTISQGQCDAVVVDKERRELAPKEYEYLVRLDVHTQEGVLRSGATVEEALWESLEPGEPVSVRYVKDRFTSIRITEIVEMASKK